MYSRLHHSCQGSKIANTSSTKFLNPVSCVYYNPHLPVATNISNSTKINVKYNFKCIDYQNLANNFEKIINQENKTQQTQQTQQTQDNGNRFDPIYWGPSAWKFLETVAFGYPENPTSEEQHAVINFLNALEYVLPCEKCKIHFSQNLKNKPVDALNRDTLSRWVVDMHNIVNESLGKDKVTYESVSEKYPIEKCKTCRLDFD